MSILDYNIINNFRSRVNQDRFVYFYYSNRDGKNNYNCICSCMDWIEVAVDYINNYSFKKTDKLNEISIDFYTYISCIDIIYESVNQLTRVLLNSDKTIFRNDNDCFLSKCKSFTNKDDNTYFKEIRACFGAHPVNIGSKGHKYFASWPTRSYFSDNTYSVAVYKSNISDDDFIFEVKIDELNSFVIKRYKYIEELTSFINNQYAKFCEEKKQDIIMKDDDIYEYIKNLINASKERLDLEDYRWTLTFIDDVIRFEDMNNYIVLNEYKEYMISFLDEIRDELQNMNFEKCFIDQIFTYVPQELSIYISTLIKSHNLYETFPEQEEIKLLLSGVINFDGVYNVKDMLILTLAGLFRCRNKLLKSKKDI